MLRHSRILSHTCRQVRVSQRADYGAESSPLFLGSSIDLLLAAPSTIIIHGSVHIFTAPTCSTSNVESPRFGTDTHLHGQCSKPCRTCVLPLRTALCRSVARLLVRTLVRLLVYRWCQSPWTWPLGARQVAAGNVAALNVPTGQFERSQSRQHVARGRHGHARR